MIRRLVRNYLQAGGYDVVVAGSATSALRMFELYRPVRVVVSEITIPGMSGFELADRLHQIVPDLPVLFMSRHRQASGCPNRVVMDKPIHFANLRNAIELALSGADCNRMSDR